MNSEIEEIIINFIEGGHQLLTNGEYSQLKELCEEFLKIYSDERVYLMLSTACYALGDYRAAEESSRRGFELNPKSPDHVYNLACIMKNQGRFSNAWRFFKRAFKNAADGELKDLCIQELNAIEKHLNKDEAALFPKEQSKRVLIIAYIYPPLSGSGVQRTLKLVKYMRVYGWEPVVVTVNELPNKDQVGKEYFDEIPDDIEVIRINSKTFYTMKDLERVKNKLCEMLSSKLHSEFENIYSRNDNNLKLQLCSFPEPAVFWAQNIIDSIEQYVDMDKINLIYSTSGPYSDHIAGYYLKQQFNKPWVVDFRDEWSKNPAIWSDDKNTFFYRMCVDIEKEILKFADEVICVTEASEENYLRLGVPLEKLICITNGYDEEDFEGIEGLGQKNDKFTLVHNGVLYLDRTPNTMLVAISNLISSGKVDRNKIVFHMGSALGKNLEIESSKIISELDLMDIALFTPYMNHRDSLKLAASADSLILLLGPSEKYVATYPGKTFEYLRFGKRVLSLGPKKSVIERIINKTNHGINIEFNDTAAIEDEIFEQYSLWLNGHDATIQKTDTSMYERQVLVKKHSNVFKRAVQNFDSLKRI